MSKVLVYWSVSMLFIIYSIVKRFELCSKNICTIIVEPIKYSLTKKKIVNLFLRETGSPWEMLPFQGVTYISQTTIFNYQTCPTLSGSLFINHCDHVTITCSMIKRATHGNAWGNGGWIKQGLQWFIQQISDEKDKTFTPFTWPNSTCQTAFRFTVKIKL